MAYKERNLKREVYCIFFLFLVVNGSSKCLSCFLFSLVNYNGAYSPFKNVKRTNKRASILNDMSHGPSIPPDLLLTGKNGTSTLGQIFFSGSDDWRRGRPQEALLAGSSEFKLSELEVYYGKLLHGFRKQLMYIILIFFPLSFFCLDFALPFVYFLQFRY